MSSPMQTCPNIWGTRIKIITQWLGVPSSPNYTMFDFSDLSFTFSSALFEEDKIFGRLFQNCNHKRRGFQEKGPLENDI